MRNLRKYGSAPFSVAVVHGGPGAPGEMALVARELASIKGVLEPLQTTNTVEGQVQELKAVLKRNGSLPVTLIGFSWGAMLSFIFTASCPSFVKKLILISSGAYEEEYATDIMGSRLVRLGQEERKEVITLIERFNDPDIKDKSALMAQFGRYMFKADSYDPLPHDDEIIEYQYYVNIGVWEQAAALRSSGRLLALGRQIKCPVVAIHGDYDPHLTDGVAKPLSDVLENFRFILLEKCGHYPWLERNAREEFYRLLRNEV